MRRDEQFWFGIAALLVAVAGLIAGVSSQSFSWTSVSMQISYGFAFLAAICVVAAIRGADFPLLHREGLEALEDAPISIAITEPVMLPTGNTANPAWTEGRWCHLRVKNEADHPIECGARLVKVEQETSAGVFQDHARFPQSLDLKWAYQGSGSSTDVATLEPSEHKMLDVAHAYPWAPHRIGLGLSDKYGNRIGIPNEIDEGSYRLIVTFDVAGYASVPFVVRVNWPGDWKGLSLSAAQGGSPIGDLSLSRQEARDLFGLAYKAAADYRDNWAVDDGSILELRHWICRTAEAAYGEGEAALLDANLPSEASFDSDSRGEWVDALRGALTEFIGRADSLTPRPDFDADEWRPVL